MEDTTLTCRDCNTVFAFTVKDQLFFESNGYAVPKRCRACRQKRRDNRAPKLSKCCNAPMINGGIQCENCGSDGR